MSNPSAARRHPLEFRDIIGGRVKTVLTPTTIALLAATACLAEPPPKSASPPPVAHTVEPAPAPPRADLPAPAPGVSSPEPLASPDHPRFDASLPTEVSVAGDHLAHVAQGAVGDRRALVYMHGHCGNVHAFRPWSEAAVRFGTVIAVLGEEACEESGRFKWGTDLGRTNDRILRAIRAVSAVRGAPLDEDDVTLIGYSQGSARAERLMQKYPSRYRRGLFIAGPREHAAASFGHALGVAIIAGGRDLKDHLRDAAAKAQKAGVRARYFELPGARHGEYGPEAVRVMGDALGWVFGKGEGAE